MENAAPVRTEREAIDEEVRAAIVERSPLDVILLAEAERLFDARCARMRQERGLDGP